MTPKFIDFPVPASGGTFGLLRLHEEDAIRIIAAFDRIVVPLNHGTIGRIIMCQEAMGHSDKIETICRAVELLEAMINLHKAGNHIEIVDNSGGSTKRYPVFEEDEI